jgi:hypothetical protein
MNQNIKLIIYFFTGIILYYLLFNDKEKLVEGFDEFEGVTTDNLYLALGNEWESLYKKGNEHWDVNEDWCCANDKCKEDPKKFMIGDKGKEGGVYYSGGWGSKGTDMEATYPRLSRPLATCRKWDMDDGTTQSPRFQNNIRILDIHKGNKCTNSFQATPTEPAIPTACKTNEVLFLPDCFNSNNEWWQLNLINFLLNNKTDIYYDDYSGTESASEREGKMFPAVSTTTAHSSTLLIQLKPSDNGLDTTFGTDAAGVEAKNTWMTTLRQPKDGLQAPCSGLPGLPTSSRTARCPSWVQPAGPAQHRRSPDGTAPPFPGMRIDGVPVSLNGHPELKMNPGDYFIIKNYNKYNVGDSQDCGTSTIYDDHKSPIIIYKISNKRDDNLQPINLLKGFGIHSDIKIEYAVEFKQDGENLNPPLTLDENMQKSALIHEMYRMNLGEEEWSNAIVTWVPVQTKDGYNINTRMEESDVKLINIDPSTIISGKCKGNTTSTEDIDCNSLGMTEKDDYNTMVGMSKEACCNPCDANSQWANPITNQCLDWTNKTPESCEAGSQWTTGTASSNSTCTPCEGTQWSDAGAACKNWTNINAASCGAGSQWTTGTPSSDSDCVTCGGTQWSPEPGAACVDWTSNEDCQSPQIWTGGSSTKDSSCVSSCSEFTCPAGKKKLDTPADGWTPLGSDNVPSDVCCEPVTCDGMSMPTVVGTNTQISSDSTNILQSAVNNFDTKIIYNCTDEISHGINIEYICGQDGTFKINPEKNSCIMDCGTNKFYDTASNQCKDWTNISAGTCPPGSQWTAGTPSSDSDCVTCGGTQWSPEPGAACNNWTHINDESCDTGNWIAGSKSKNSECVTCGDTQWFDGLCKNWRHLNAAACEADAPGAQWTAGNPSTNSKCIAPCTDTQWSDAGAVCKDWTHINSASCGAGSHWVTGTPSTDSDCVTCGDTQWFDGLCKDWTNINASSCGAGSNWTAGTASKDSKCIKAAGKCENFPCGDKVKKESQPVCKTSICTQDECCKDEEDSFPWEILVVVVVVLGVAGALALWARTSVKAAPENNTS